MFEIDLSEIIKFLSTKSIVYLCARMHDVWKHKLNTVLEHRDKSGRRVYIFRLGKSFTLFLSV